jgi:hypothetical protein
MEKYRIEVKINEMITEYVVVPFITDEVDNQFKGFCNDVLSA